MATGSAYSFCPLLSIWLVLIPQMENDILYQGCWALLRIGWKGIRTALPTSQTSTGWWWKRWALHQCCHQTLFLRKGAATGPIADICGQPLPILHTHSRYADCDKGPSLAHLNEHFIRLIKEEFVCVTGSRSNFRQIYYRYKICKYFNKVAGV